MAETYMTLTTNACDAAVAAALATGATVTFKYLAVGDGGGSYYEPAKDQTALRGEKWRGECVVSRDPGNAKRVIITASIPSSVGGFQVREAGVFLADGTMMVASKQPLSDKVAPSSGAGKDMTIQLYVEVVDQIAVTITINPSAQWAPLQDFNAHVENMDIHTTAAEKSAINTHLTDEVRHISATERQTWNGKAETATYTTTLPAAGWQGAAAPYTQTVAVAGILVTDTPHYTAVYSGTNDQKIAQQEAWSMVSEDSTANGSITFVCFEDKPEVDLALQLEVIR
ncbi:phage tail protein [Anaerotruncus rubiinfantis]|uniref:phage tail-collar fiber domain-containing protein n=1 Tax=Anaerotruncus rubiinfantis TaxID=1720200 RepID=UPI0011CCD4AF|nr:phage tail protein [Anaerotruncus rubiinfantis]